MNRLAASAAVAAVALIGVTAPAFATTHPDTVTRSWYLPVGVNPNTAPFTDWWPQTVKAPQGCAWTQVDTYRYDTPAARAVVDHLADDGLLTLNGGTPEDSAVYVSHFFTPPGQGCATPTPSETTWTSPTPTTATPSTSVPPTSTTTSQPPSPSPTSSTSTSPTTSPTTSPETSSTGPVTTSTTRSTGSRPPSSPTAASPRRSVPSTTGAPPEELARTGVKPDDVIAGVLLLLLGVAMHAARRLATRTGRH